MVITEGCHVDNGSQGGIHFDNLTFNVLDNLTFNVQNIEFYIGQFTRGRLAGSCWIDHFMRGVVAGRFWIGCLILIGQR